MDIYMVFFSQKYTCVYDIVCVCDTIVWLYLHKTVFVYMAALKSTSHIKFNPTRISMKNRSQPENLMILSSVLIS